MTNKTKKTDQLLREHLNRKSYRTLEDEYGITSKTICSFTNSVTKQLINSNELTKLLKPRNYCGIILADGKYMSVKRLSEETKTSKIRGHIPYSGRPRGKTKKGLVIIPFIDYETHDIPVYIISASENGYEIGEGFKKLKELGYPLKAVVCDESMGEIAQTAKKVFPDAVVQLCLTHYSKCIEREFLVNGVKRTIRKLERKLDKLGDSIFISTRHYDIKRAVKWTNELADLEFEYGILIGLQNIFQEIFWKAETPEDLTKTEDRMNGLLSYVNLKTHPHAAKIKKRYLDYYAKQDMITAFMCYPGLKIPRTTNLIEGFNSTTLELRLSSIRGFEKEETARNYINALILKRRFQKFKCCKGKFKNLNGRSPIEIANPLHDLKNLCSKDWVKLCRKLKK